MCGKDDGPPPPNYAGQARAEIMVERERARLAEEQRVKEEMRQAAERTRLQGEFDQDLSSAYNQSLGYAQDRVQGRGLSWDEYGQPIQSELDRVRSSVPRLSTNVGSYFGDDLVDRVLGRVRDNRRATYGQQANQLTPLGFERDYVKDDFDDNVLNSIYGEQYGEANDMLTRAIARGKLSRVGQDSARASLETQGKTGMSRLQDLGSGVLSKYRGELSEIGNRAKTEASQYDLGANPFDSERFKKQITDKTGEFGQRLEGDLRSATKGENLFNVEQLIGKAGQSQGLYNPSTADQVSSSPIFDALKSRGELRRKQRGLAPGSY